MSAATITTKKFNTQQYGAISIPAYTFQNDAYNTAQSAYSSTYQYWGLTWANGSGIQSGGHTIGTFNVDSPLWIVYDGNFTAPWNYSDSEWHDIITLSDGKKIRFKYSTFYAYEAFVDLTDAENRELCFALVSTQTSGWRYICLTIYEDLEGRLIPIIMKFSPSDGIFSMSWFNTYSGLNDFFVDSIVKGDPYGNNDNQTPAGGYGTFDYDGDDVDIPALPTLSAAACGFVGLYNPTAAELKALADYMWTGLLDLSTYKKIFGDPMDCILSVGIIPVTPSRSTNKEALDFGNFLSTGVTAYKITSQFTEVDCGSITVKGASASAMDYAPFTKAELFLPFCGTHSLAVDEIMDSTLTVKYHIDLYTGACVAYVKVAFPTDGRSNSDGSKLDSVMYQFTGNVLATIPVTSANHAQFIQSVLFAAAATAATVASGGAAAAEAAKAGEAYGIVSEGGAAISAGSAIKSVMATKPDIMKSGNLTANAGFLGLKKPVLTLTQPNLCRPEDEYKLAGMPKQTSGTLSDFSGFTVVSACHMDNILCTETERELILKALCEGVII